MTLGPHPPNHELQQQATDQARLDLIRTLEERLEQAHRRITMLEEMLGWEKRALIGRSRGVHNWYRKALTKKEFERTPVNRHERLLTRVTTRYILSVLSYSPR
jgi:hypothetical protein